MIMISEYLQMCGYRTVGGAKPQIEEPVDEVEVPVDLLVVGLNVPDQTAVL